MIQIIPAIDLIDGHCVRLTQGDYSQKKIYNENPLEVAKSFEDAGITRLHLVDLDGAKQKRIINHKILELIATKTNLHIDFGGGVQSDEMIEIAFNSGAKQVTGGSVAVKNPALFESWLQIYGGEKIILGADARDEKIAISGWEEATTKSVYDFVGEYIKKGAKYAISTDVAKDGLLQGPSFDLYQNLQDQFPDLQIIASGGVAEFDDIVKLNDMNIFGVIVGKAIYEGRVTLKQLAEFNR
ncbi:MAG: 1-(5-phosphoribosyl)-5-[(5-phosphoribosylamino)methylideneamino]imidazole-4-carboxamide isomerase [Arcicella sp.]|nr:1-(5-phosphoribosyl)-5-[(5-phosphoribosylamino)methylideneamino]imidazole-4-carboxamide isomerase [Arcicella sp.]